MSAFGPKANLVMRASEGPLSATSGTWQASQGVLIDLAVFHDDDQVFARIFQQLDVEIGSPVNEQQVIASQVSLGTRR
jgi:hypothetical protein